MPRCLLPLLCMAATGLTCHAGLAQSAPSGAPAGPASKPTPSAPAKATRAGAPLSSYVAERVASILKVLDDGGDLAKAQAGLRTLLDVCLAYAPATEGSAFAEIVGPLRLVDQLSALPKSAQGAALKYLRANPALAAELAFAISETDTVPAAYRVLEQLRAAHGDRIAAYPALTAAVCIVYDRPHEPATAGPPKKDPPKKDAPKVDPIDPAQVLGYFVRNEARMAFGLRSLPVECMTYLVETSAGIDELEWAGQKYAGDRNIGKRYYDIVYDTAAFKYNQDKKVAAAGYTLQNIARVGGVCQEQAYFAAHAARAIGVPGAHIYGRSGDVAHAWVGFLQDRGGALVWNMEEGHYDDYEDLEGTLIDPQSGRWISDSQFAMSADVIPLSVTARRSAVALVDAAKRLEVIENTKAAYPPERPAGIAGLRTKPRTADLAGRLELLSASLAENWASPRAWDAIAAAAPRMTSSDRRTWFNQLWSRCGQKHPRYAYHVMAAMIQGVEDPRDQSAAWDWAFDRFHNVPDLAADTRIRQGKCWEAAGDKARAYQAYVDAAHRFANDGPFVVDALGLAEALLDSSGKTEAIAEMYKDAWRRISRPENTSANAFRQSNFYRVGDRYAAVLDKLGRASDAATVRKQIDRGIDKNGK